MDRCAPLERFDGGGSSIVPGSGWSRPDRSTVGDEEETSAWVDGREARVSFRTPPVPGSHFYASLRPFSYPGAPQQTLQVVLDGKTAGSLPLRPGWQEVRLPLPELVGSRPHTLSLRFAHATAPSAVVESGDTRELAASFRTLAILPEGAGDPERYLAAARLDPIARAFTLPEGGCLSLPLPVRRSLVLNLRTLEAVCASCTVQIAALDGEHQPTVLHESEPEPGQSIRVPTGRARELQVRVRPADWTALAPQGVVMSLESLVSAGKGRRGRRGRPDIFVYAIDTLRADAIRQPDGPLLPAFRQLARDGVTFTRAWSPSSWTLPSTASLMTGVHPHRHGVMQGDVPLTEERFPTIGRLLAGRGYRTLGLSQSFVVGPRLGLDTGFETFVLDDQLNGYELRSQRVRGYFVQWLLGLPSRDPPPIFAYLHTVDPHAPYSAGRARSGDVPASWRQARPGTFLDHGWHKDPSKVRWLRELYQREAEYASRELGLFLELLRFLDLYDDSLIVVLSEHGEEFAEHGGLDHGRTVYEEMLHVPLVVKLPGNRGAGSVVRERVSTLDVFATALDAAGVGLDTLGVDSASLVSLVGDDDRDRASAVFAEVNPAPSERQHGVDLRALAIDDLKCIESRSGADQFGRPVPRWQVFDLDRDPQEQSPLAEEDPRTRWCAEELRRRFPGGASRSPATTPRVERETRDHLRRLGYIR